MRPPPKVKKSSINTNVPRSRAPCTAHRRHCMQTPTPPTLRTTQFAYDDHVPNRVTAQSASTTSFKTKITTQMQAQSQCFCSQSSPHFPANTTHGVSLNLERWFFEGVLSSETLLLSSEPLFHGTDCNTSKNPTSDHLIRTHPTVPNSIYSLLAHKPTQQTPSGDGTTLLTGFAFAALPKQGRHQAG